MWQPIVLRLRCEPKLFTLGLLENRKLFVRFSRRWEARFFTDATLLDHVSIGRITTTSIGALFLAILFAGRWPRQFVQG